MRNTEDVQEILRDNSKIMRDQFRVTQLKIFGSYARGEQSSNSDLDLLISYDKAPTLWMLSELKDYLETVLGMKVDVVTERGLKQRIRDRVLAEAIDI